MRGPAPTLRRLATVGLLIALAGIAGRADDRRPVSHLPAAPDLLCSGNDQVDVVDRHILTRANAIEAHGNCRVRVIGAHLLADGIAVLATGNAVVVIEHSFVQGTQHAIKVTGNAVVHYRESTLRGPVFAAAGGKALDEGGNSVERLPSPVRAPLVPTATLRCDDRELIVLVHRWVDVPGNGIEVAEGCSLTLSDSHVRAGGWGIRIARGGEATIRNSVIETGKGGIEVADGGVLHVAGSSVPGGIHVLGEAATTIDGGGNAWDP